MQSTHRYWTRTKKERKAHAEEQGKMKSVEEQYKDGYTRWADPANPKIDDDLKAVHNAKAKTLVASFEQSAAREAIAMHHAEFARDRMKHRAAFDRYKRKAREAALTILK